MWRRSRVTPKVPARSPRKARADVLLVYPIWVERGADGWPPWSTLQRMLPPLGILSIASVLEEAGFEVHVADLHCEQLTPEEFRGVLRRLRPRFVGVSVLSAHFVAAHHIARICKEEVADVKVIAGGVHAESCPEQMLRSASFDAVGRGDGERLMLEFVQGRPYADIAGLSYRGARGVTHNPLPTTVADLDDYPLPAYHLIDFSHYLPPPGSYRDLPAMNVLMTRGCPGKCTFCNSAETQLRSRSARKMVELIKRLRDEHGVRQLYFYDDTFTATPRTVRELCDAMIAERVDVKWICYVRGDMFSDDLARRMAAAGCHQVLIGIESGSAKLMRDIGKPIDKERYLKTVATAHRHGMEVRGSFIIGHREETRETLEETLAFAIEMDIDLFQLSIMTPYPGTLLFRQAKQEGWLLHEDYARYGQNQVVLDTPHLTAEEIVAFSKRAYLRFYLRPRAVWGQLKRLANLHQVADLFTTFYSMFLEGDAKRGRVARAELARQWLDFDLEAGADRSIGVGVEPRLSFEVRLS